jgi:hypothetical protein
MGAITGDGTGCACGGGTVTDCSFGEEMGTGSGPAAAEISTADSF